MNPSQIKDFVRQYKCFKDNGARLTSVLAFDLALYEILRQEGILDESLFFDLFHRRFNTLKALNWLEQTKSPLYGRRKKSLGNDVPDNDREPI